MRPLNVNYDGTGWNANYVSGLTEDEFVDQFAAVRYGHLPIVADRIKAARMAHKHITSEFRKIYPHVIEKPVVESDDE